MLDIIYLFEFQLAALVIISSSISTLMMFLLFRQTKSKLEIWLNSNMELISGGLGLNFKKGANARGGFKSGQTRALKATESHVVDTMLNAFPEVQMAQPILNALNINVPVDDFMNGLKKNPSGAIAFAMKYAPLAPPEIRDRVMSAVQQALPITDPNFAPSQNLQSDIPMQQQQQPPMINYSPSRTPNGKITPVNKLRSK